MSRWLGLAIALSVFGTPALAQEPTLVLTDTKAQHREPLVAAIVATLAADNVAVRVEPENVEAAKKDSALKVLAERLGANPLLVARQIAWSPRKKTAVFQIRGLIDGKIERRMLYIDSLDPTTVGEAIGRGFAQWVAQPDPPPPPAPTQGQVTAKPKTEDNADPAPPQVDEPPLQTKTSTAEQYGRLGRRALREDRFTDAKAWFRKCLDEDRYSARCHRGLGITYALLGQTNRSYNAYRCYLQVAPRAEDADQVKEFLRVAPEAKCDLPPVRKDPPPPPEKRPIRPIKPGEADKKLKLLSPLFEKLNDTDERVADASELRDAMEPKPRPPTDLKKDDFSDGLDPPSSLFNVGMAIGGTAVIAGDQKMALGNFSLRFRSVAGQLPGRSGGRLHAFDFNIDIGAIGGLVITDLPPVTVMGTVVERERTENSALAGGRAHAELGYLFLALDPMNPENGKQRGVGVRVGLLGGAQAQFVFDGQDVDELVPLFGPYIGLEFPGYDARNRKYRAFSFTAHVVPLSNFMASLQMVFTF